MNKEHVLNKIQEHVQELNKTYHTLEQAEIGQVFKMSRGIFIHDQGRVVVEYVVKLLKYHQATIRFKILASSLELKRSNKWDSDELSLKFNELGTLEPFDRSQAPLIINYEYVSEQFKKEYLGA